MRNTEDHRIAVEVEEAEEAEEEKEEEEEVKVDIKSNNPHLTGGEKSHTAFAVVPFLTQFETLGLDLPSVCQI